MGSSLEREGRGGERSRAARLGAPWGGAARSNSLLVAALRVFCFLREKKKTTGRREEREEKEEEKEKKEKMGEICKHEIFWKNKIKYNLWSWSKIIFV
jgi:hypothetical protein